MARNATTTRPTGVRATRWAARRCTSAAAVTSRLPRANEQQQHGFGRVVRTGRGQKSFGRQLQDQRVASQHVRLPHADSRPRGGPGRRGRNIALGVTGGKQQQRGEHHVVQSPLGHPLQSGPDIGRSRLQKTAFHHHLGQFVGDLLHRDPEILLTPVVVRAMPDHQQSARVS